MYIVSPKAYRGFVREFIKGTIYMVGGRGGGVLSLHTTVVIRMLTYADVC